MTTDGTSFARAFVRSLAEEAGWPRLQTRKGEVPAGEAAWRRFLADCTIFDLGAAERALEALSAGEPAKAGAVTRRPARR